MSTSIQSTRPLAGLKQALRQCRAERQRCRRYATQLSQTSHEASSLPPPSSRPATKEQWAANPKSRRPGERSTQQSVDALDQATNIYPSLMPKSSALFKGPTKGFRPSQAIKQNRYDDGMRPIPTIPPPRSTLKACKDPINIIYQDQLKVLDPTGARTRLFALSNAERVQPGDILLVRLKNGDDFSGVCLNIRQRNSPIDTAILLRNHLTRLPVEMWFKIYSPNVEGIEIVQRKEKRARRAKLYYMRKPKHDLGSVEGIVRQYQRQRMGMTSGKSTKGRDANSHRKKSNKKGAKK